MILLLVREAELNRGSGDREMENERAAVAIGEESCGSFQLR